MNNNHNSEIPEFIGKLIDIAEDNADNCKNNSDDSIVYANTEFDKLYMKINLALCTPRITKPEFINAVIMAILESPATLPEQYNKENIKTLRQLITDCVNTHPYFDKQGRRTTGYPIANYFNVFIRETEIRDTQIYTGNSFEDSIERTMSDDWDDFTPNAYVDTVVAYDTDDACDYAAKKHGYNKAMLYAVRTHPN